MKQAYPIILTPSENGYVAYIPDLDINAEGKDVADTIDMAADAIGIWGISAQDMGHEIPAPSVELPHCDAPQTTAFTLVDFDAYRRESRDDPHECHAAEQDQRSGKS